jgi:anti-sigma regulatory factor (Ser/Thr protein kinase)
MSRAGFAPTLDMTLDSSPRAPAEARRAVEDLGCDLDLTDPVDITLLRDAQLLVSELVTNSVRHSGSDGPIRVRAWVREADLRMEIADCGAGFEKELGPTEEHAESGRGLLILDALTDRWGVSRDAHTRVWFEMGRRPPSAAHFRTA